MAQYIREGIEPGASIRWGSISDKPTIREYECDKGWVEYPGVEVHEVPYCAYGDYDNSTMVERSNYRSMLRDFAEELIEVTGDYDSHKLIYMGEPSEALAEAIEGLESYPLYDESDESELEQDESWAQWQDWGRKEFSEMLAAYMRKTFTDRTIDRDDLCSNYYGDEDVKREEEIRKELDDLWYAGVEAFLGGEGHVCEGGGGIYFPMRRWFEHLEPRFGDSRKDVLETISDLMFRKGWLIPGADKEADICIEIGTINLWKVFQ